MEELLVNPVYNALLSGDAQLSLGTGPVRFFDEAVSPFAGFADDFPEGFDELSRQLSGKRRILYANPSPIEQPAGWEVLNVIKGLQFLLTGNGDFEVGLKPVPLQQNNIDEMIELAKLTRPGPFGPRTIEFGHYYGIFENGRLAAMTGQRLHVPPYTEISAVCTHPDHAGKGFAGALVQHQINLIRSQDQIPFLHVREDNSRAIALYERLGFVQSRPMYFYFLRKAS